LAFLAVRGFLHDIGLWLFGILFRDIEETFVGSLGFEDASESGIPSVAYSLGECIKGHVGDCVGSHIVLHHALVDGIMCRVRGEW